jgi:cytochrome c oxidase subunit 2
MNLGEMFRSRLDKVSSLALGLSLALMPGMAAAQEAAPAADAPAPAGDAAAATGEAAATYTPMGADMIKGAPEPGGWWFQPQHNEIGADALWMHNYILVPVITIVSLVVLFLLIWVVARYNKRANPVPSKTSHNTILEVLWTAFPILILVGIAIPSVGLLLKQYESPPESALTVKVTGYQWYWGYTYPDNGGFEVISNMLKEKDEVAAGERFRTEDDGPEHLAADNRMVVPVGVPIRIQAIGSDVIHSFAVPSLWFKIDAVPGRLNEMVMQVDEPGIYFGQCSELCGARHGYMPIAIEAVPVEQFNAWILTQGGTVGGEEAAPAAAPAVPAPEAPAPDAAAPAAATEA